MVNNLGTHSSDIDHDSPLALLHDICVYVASDCTVVIEDIDRLATAAADDDKEYSCCLLNVLMLLHRLHVSSLQWMRACVIIVPLRLGSEHCNPLYASHLRTLFSLESCLGLIGGKPKHGMYFVGWHRESLIYLDPHLCQKAEDLTSATVDIDEVELDVS